MSTHPGRLRVVRSMLFIPGHLEPLLAKGAASPADCLALDLEDAVPPDKKAVARAAIRASLEAGAFAGRPAFVRLNSFETGHTQEDLRAVACAPLSGFVYARSRTPEEVHALEPLLAERERELGLGAGHFCLIPLVETAAGVLNAQAIATASPRVVALLFGGEDYLAEMGGRKDPDELCFHTPRVQVILAARAAGIEPIDTPYVDVRDEAGLRAHARRGRNLGMAGMGVMSPRQIAAVHEIYTPTEAEIQEARQMLAALQATREAGRGLTVQDGVYISPVGERKACRLLEQVEAIGELKARNPRRKLRGGSMSFGRYYEEFEVGQTLAHWPGRTITEADNMLFSMLTMNHHPLHIDANFAAHTQHKQPLVVGTLVFSLVVGMTVPDVSGHAIANLEYTEVRHLGPTFVGDTLYAHTTILDKRESRSKPDRGVVSVETVATNQRGEKVLSFKRAVLIPKRAAGPAAAGPDVWGGGAG